MDRKYDSQGHVLEYPRDQGRKFWKFFETFIEYSSLFPMGIVCSRALVGQLTFHLFRCIIIAQHMKLDKYKKIPKLFYFRSYWLEFPDESQEFGSRVKIHESLEKNQTYSHDS